MSEIESIFSLLTKENALKEMLQMPAKSQVEEVKSSAHICEKNII